MEFKLWLTAPVRSKMEDAKLKLELHAPFSSFKASLTAT
jgi:hypothetical protein